MYADRYARPERIKPGSLTVAIALNAAVIGALMFSSPAIRDKLPLKPFDGFNVPVEQPPEPIPPEIKPRPHEKTIASPPERLDTSVAIGGMAGSDHVLPPPPPLPPFPGTGGTVIDPPVTPPVLTGATPDPRFARDLQPPYPPGERRAEHEGSVQLSIRIGADGRVTQAECLRADSDAFCRASREQALAKWRFRPATRDAVPIAADRVMTVRFRLEQ